MKKDFEKEEMIFIKNRNGVKVPICPDCINHEQGEPEDVLDCKNLYVNKYKDEKVIERGQCNCWSKEHGMRD